MRLDDKYLYEVAFSFLQGDEDIAHQINDLIQDRFSTFIYSKKQEILGGTDGEKKFNTVFYEESRVVVILYRDGWAQTPWTRIEETAIKNRAFDKGWEFLILINLDTKSTIPTWIPKSYIWLDYKKYKPEGSIAVIDQRVREAGGKIKVETIPDRAKRYKRLRNAVFERQKYLNSTVAISAARNEIVSIITKLKDLKPQIEDPETFFHLSTIEREDAMFGFGNNDFFVAFNCCSPFNYKIENGLLRVILFEKQEHYDMNETEKVFQSEEFKFDRDLVGNNGWASTSNKKNSFQTSDDLIDKWVKKFLDELSNRNQNNG